MKKLLHIPIAIQLVLMLGLAGPYAFAGVHRAASCSSAHVDAQRAAMEKDRDKTVEVVIPACTGASAGHWTGVVNFVMPDTATLLLIHGAGSTFVDGGGNATVLYDDRTADNTPIFIVTPNSTGGIARVYGITFIQTNNTRSLGSLNISGHYNTADTPQRFRVDHCTFTAKAVGVGFGGRVIGVADHNIFNLDPGVAVFFNSWSDAQGDISWTEDTGLGSLNFPVLEDNIINVGTSMVTRRSTGGVQDSYRGSRFVVRFNDVDRAATQTHPTGGSNRARGTRAWEIYGNEFRNKGPNPGIKEFNVFFASSGTGVVWGNDSGDIFDNFITGHVNRRDGDPYDQAAPPDGWGFCGPAYQTGTVNTSGRAVTRVTGNNFSTSWQAKKIVIAGKSYTISSINSSTSITLADSAGTQTGAAYTLGSNWDGNTDANTGYPCIDQIGRGKGDRLFNDFGPTMQNQATRATYTRSTAWPRQALEPVYVWSNDFTGNHWTDSGMHGAALADRDYYLDTGSRMGTGTSLPTSCNENDGFYDTNAGDWLTATPEHGVATVAEGVLYKCNAKGAWVAYYEPLPYPHPYIALTGAGASTPPAQRPAR